MNHPLSLCSPDIFHVDQIEYRLLNVIREGPCKTPTVMTEWSNDGLGSRSTWNAALFVLTAERAEKHLTDKCYGGNGFPSTIGEQN
jgi:hypothetical protein